MILYDQIILLFHKKTKQLCILLKMYAEQSTSLRDILTYFRQHRTEIVVQMRSQILRQIVHKFRRHTDVCQEICVQDAGKYASRCATKPSGGLCAVLP